MTRVLQGRSYAALLSGLASFFQTWTREGEVLILAATRAAADDFVRDHAGGGALGVHRYTLRQLAASLASSVVSVSALGSEAIAARAVHRLIQEGGLAYFGPVASTPGFAGALASTLAELRSEGVDAASLEKAGKPGADLARLLQAYNQELAARGLADLPSLYASATEVALSGSHRLLGLPVACLDPDVRHRSEREFLEAVLRRAPEAVSIQLGDGAPGGRMLDVVRRSVFSLEAPAPAQPDGSVEIFSAPGEGMECVEIARRILALASDSVPFDHCAIVLRDPEHYQPLVEEALRRARIPAYFSRGSARPDPSGRAFLALLACASEGCSASRFAEYLSLGQLPENPVTPEWEPADAELTPPSADEPQVATPAGWEKLLVDAAVIGGPDRWRRRLQGLEQEFHVKLLAAEDEAEHARIEWRIGQLRNLERYALPLIDRLGALPTQASWGVWLDRLAELAQYALRWPASVLSVMAELEPMENVGPVELEEVAGVLQDRLRFFRAEPEGRRYGCVLVCSIDEIRGRQFPVVFLPGLAEGLFPKRHTENPLLLDHYRRALNAGLRLRDDLVAEERERLMIALAAASRKLVVSYPSMDTGLSRTRVPSFYVLEIARAMEGRLPDLSTFKQRTAAAAQTRLSWPAPLQTEAAIDDAEYDLASLKAYLEGKETEKGSARYLLEVSGPLRRSVRARGQRWRPSWFEPDGFVSLDDRAHAILKEHRLTQRPYSPSTLQQFASCPYRFALHALYGLHPREEAEALEQMDPLTRGALFHAVQFELFRELRAQGLSIEKPALDRIFDIADEVLARVVPAYEERLAPAIPRVWATEVDDLKTDVRAWLREVAILDSGWRPVRFEFGFGWRGAAGEAHDPSSTAEHAVILNGYRVRGSMDLVEEHAQTGVLRVVDHKTGKAPERTPISVGGGAALQPLIYALAGEHLWNQPVQSGRLFYCTQRGNFQRVDIAVNDAGRQRLERALQTIEASIDTGFLPAFPAKGACAYCDYRIVCGPEEERRIQRKKPEGLVELEELRSLA